MPVYVYQAVEPEKGCAKCASEFEVTQSIKDERLAVCPECGRPVQRLIQAPALGRSKFDLDYRAKRAGFTKLKKVDKGAYEKLY